MNNLKVFIISILSISIIIFLGIKLSSALFNNDNKNNSKLLLTYFDNENINIANFNDENTYEFTFALSNLTNEYLKYSLVWTDVMNNLDTKEDVENVTYTLSSCDESYNNCNKIIEENTMLPATTNKTLAAIPNVINQYIEGNKVIYYKLSIKSNSKINKSFSGNIKLVNID